MLLRDSSLSARRAWIEMLIFGCWTALNRVALRKESVDRNTSIDNLTQGVFKSLSARRAWIEISNHQTVDFHIARRSPQGERG